MKWERGMLRKLVWGALLASWCLSGQAYKLPDDCYDNSGIDLTCGFINIIPVNDGTYNIYGLGITQPEPFIYHTKPADLQDTSSSNCLGPILYSFDFSYIKNKFPTETVFFRKDTNELSQTYTNLKATDGGYLCASKKLLIAELNNNEDSDALIIQPVFKTQSKIWINIPVPKDMNTTFPGIPEAKFSKNGWLYLPIKISGDDPNHIIIEKTETIPIDYSIFDQKMDKPTCYTIPTDHKMRLCTPEEAAIRSPALTQFLEQR